MGLITHIHSVYICQIGIVVEKLGFDPSIYIYVFFFFEYGGDV